MWWRHTKLQFFDGSPASSWSNLPNSLQVSSICHLIYQRTTVVLLLHCQPPALVGKCNISHTSFSSPGTHMKGAIEEQGSINCCHQKCVCLTPSVLSWFKRPLIACAWCMFLCGGWETSRGYSSFQSDLFMFFLSIWRWRCELWFLCGPGLDLLAESPWYCQNLITPSCLETNKWLITVGTSVSKCG